MKIKAQKNVANNTKNAHKIKWQNANQNYF